MLALLGGGSASPFQSRTSALAFGSGVQSVAVWKQLFPDSGVLPATPGEIRCQAKRASGQVCGTLLRDSEGRQMRDDVCCPRRGGCRHVFCAPCVLAATVSSAAQSGTVFRCPVCSQKWFSWDMRRRIESACETVANYETASMQPSSKRGRQELFTVETCSWTQQSSCLDPESAVFQTPEARSLYQAQNVSPEELASTCAISITTGGSEGGARSTWSCKLPVRDEDEEGKKGAQKTLLVLGRLLRTALVRSMKSSFGVGKAEGQVCIVVQSPCPFHCLDSTVTSVPVESIEHGQP